MRAEIISIDAISKAAAREAKTADGFLFFSKALAAVKSMNTLSVEETKATLSEWLRTGLLSAAEYRALMAFYGWECS